MLLLLLPFSNDIFRAFNFGLLIITHARTEWIRIIYMRLFLTRVARVRITYNVRVLDRNENIIVGLSFGVRVMLTRV